MDSTTFLALAMSCAPQVSAQTAHALVTVESGLNPHAIGVVGGHLLRQPRQRAEAIATARMLHAEGWNFSVGLAQINVRNFDRLNLSINSAFDPCTNLSAMQTVLGECADRAAARDIGDPAGSQRALHLALSCYYSGNFATGFAHGYVQRVVTAAMRLTTSAPVSQEAP